MDVYGFNEKYNKKLDEEKLKFLPEELKELALKALDFERKQDYVSARKMCEDALKIDDSSAADEVKVILARIFPLILKEDIEKNNQKYEEDVNSYYDFLDKITMNELMQEYIVETLIKFCELLDNEWYRPLFIKFVKKIDKKKYLTDERYVRTLESAFITVESCELHEDLKVSRLVKDFVKTTYTKMYSIEDEELDAIKKRITLNYISNYWYVTQYYASNIDEFKYIQASYPHIYTMIEGQIHEIAMDKKKMSNDLIDELMQYVVAGTTKPQLEAAMNTAYEKIMKEKDKAFVVHSGDETYKRSSKKVGRNDYCPCGSGKKYKLCCGKGI